MPHPVAQGGISGLFPGKTVFPSLWYQDPAMWGQNYVTYPKTRHYFIGKTPSGQMRRFIR